MSLMARLGGRSSRKIPFALFKDGDSVDLSSLVSGGIELKALVDSGIFIPAAGFTLIDGAYYIDGQHLVVMQLSLTKVASMALVEGTSFNVGQFAPEARPVIHPDQAGGWTYGGSAWPGDGSVIPGAGFVNSGGLAFTPQEAHASVANFYFEFLLMRWLVADASLIS